MNDHDAMTAINAAMNQYFKGYITWSGFLATLVRIVGSNAAEHEAAK